MTVHRTRKPHPQPHPTVHDTRPPGTPVDVPPDAKIGDNPEVLAILQDYVTNYAHEDRHIDGYAFSPNPSANYQHFIKGATSICYYWDSSHASTGEYSEMIGDDVLERVHEGKTTWQ